MSQPPKKTWWKLGLLQAMKDPDQRVYGDEDLVVIRDSYPKSEKHFLVLPVEDIKDLRSLTKEHLDIVQSMEEKGFEMGKQHFEGRKFKCGFHAVPSLLRLHLHVISDDYNSPCLKNIKHWNSFNTDFFIPSTKVIQDLEMAGKVILPSERASNLLLKTQLKCHKCAYIPKNFPDLKKHLLTHVK